MNKDREIFFNHDMTIKPKFEHLKDLGLFKYYFYHELENKEWTQIILNRIHNGEFWMGDNVFDISSDLAHEVVGLRKQGSLPNGVKLVKKKVELNTKVVYNGKAMVVSTIRQHDVKLLRKIITSSICASSKNDELLVGFIYAAYKI